MTILASVPRFLPVLPAAVLVAACAAGGAYAPRGIAVGDTRQHLVEMMGPPTATYAMPGGLVRLEFNHMPMGLHTYMVDLDASDRVSRWGQVLDDAHFLRLHGGMTEQEVLREIGPPTERSRWAHPVEVRTWRYRYQTPERCVVYEVAFAADTGLTLDGGNHAFDLRCGRTMS